jgi:hypothetical protein
VGAEAETESKVEQHVVGETKVEEQDKDTNVGAVAEVEVQMEAGVDVEAAKQMAVESQIESQQEDETTEAVAEGQTEEVVAAEGAGAMVGVEAVVEGEIDVANRQVQVQVGVQDEHAVQREGANEAHERRDRAPALSSEDGAASALKQEPQVFPPSSSSSAPVTSPERPALLRRRSSQAKMPVPQAGPRSLRCGVCTVVAARVTASAHDAAHDPSALLACSFPGPYRLVCVAVSCVIEACAPQYLSLSPVSFLSSPLRNTSFPLASFYSLLTVSRASTVSLSLPLSHSLSLSLSRARASRVLSLTLSLPFTHVTVLSPSRCITTPLVASRFLRNFPLPVVFVECVSMTGCPPPFMGSRRRLPRSVAHCVTCGRPTVCAGCRVTVHANCYGVCVGDGAASASLHWQCDRCFAVVDDSRQRGVDAPAELQPRDLACVACPISSATAVMRRVVGESVFVEDAW